MASTKTNNDKKSIDWKALDTKLWKVTKPLYRNEPTTYSANKFVVNKEDVKDQLVECVPKRELRLIEINEKTVSALIEQAKIDYPNATEPKPRNPLDVLRQMIAVFPEGSDQATGLHELVDDFRFMAPEIYYQLWGKITKWCNANCHAWDKDIYAKTQQVFNMPQTILPPLAIQGTFWRDGTLVHAAVTTDDKTIVDWLNTHAATHGFDGLFIPTLLDQYGRLVLDQVLLLDSSVLSCTLVKTN